MNNEQVTLLEHLKDCAHVCHEIIIDEDFIEYRNEHKDKFAAAGRTEEKRLMHADCLLIEYTLLDKKFVLRPENIKHDFIYDNHKVDVKIITTQWFNVPADKVAWYMGNIRSRDLTDFAFFKFNEQPMRPLKVGDKVKIKLCEVRNAEEVMNELKVSQGDGYYYQVKI